MYSRYHPYQSVRIFNSFSLGGQADGIATISELEGCFTLPLVDGIVVATVASQADLSALEALSRSAVQAGFPCVVVQPAAPLEAALDADQALKTALGDVRVFALPFFSTYACRV